MFSTDLVEKAKECRDRPPNVSAETWRKVDPHKGFRHLAINTPDSEIYSFAEPFSAKKFGLADTAPQGLEDHMQSAGDSKPGDFGVTQNYRKA